MSPHRGISPAKNRQLAVRLAVSRALGRTRELDDIYTAALETLAECLAVSRASVLLFDGDGVMRFKAYRGLSSEYRVAVEGHSPWTPDSTEAEPLLVPDVTREPSLASFLHVFARERIAALGFIPLISLGRVIGKFMLYYDAPHTFDDEEVELAVVIAAAVAFAVERGRAAEAAGVHAVPGQFERNVILDGTWEWEAGLELRTTAGVFPSDTLRQTRRFSLENSRDCMKILDLDGRLIYINAAGLDHLGVADAGELLRRPLIDLWAESDREMILAAFAVAKAGGTGRFQGPCQTPAGVTKWWDVMVTPIADASGNIVQLLALSRDVSAPWQAGSFQDGQHQVLEMIATGAPLPHVLALLVYLIEDQCAGIVAGVMLLDPDGAHVRLGAGPSLPAEYARHIDGQLLSNRGSNCGSVMLDGRAHIVSDMERNPRCDDSCKVAVSVGLRACWSAPIFSQHKKTLGAFAMFCRAPRAPGREELRLLEIAADLAGAAIDHHHSQEALRQSEERNRAILRAIPDWMFILSRAGVFLDYHVKNPEALLAPPDQFLGKSMHEVLPQWLADAHERAFERAFATNEPEQLEYSLDLPHERRFYEACIVPCDSDKILSIVRDITDRKRAELDAAAQRQELAHLNRVLILTEQSGALAHELSQPLAAILTNAQAARHLLDHDPLDFAELRAAVDDVIKNDKRAGAVIQRLRDLLKKSTIDLQPLDVNEVAREVLDLTRSDLQLRRMPITFALASDLPPVLGDRVQLQQVILNLVVNACDAMSTIAPAEREISLTTVADEQFVQIAITDRGVGIPEAELDSVFEPFVTHRPQGLGLGLSISRSIVRAHHGRMEAQNNANGRGATFRCFLPVAGKPLTGFSENPTRI